MRTYIRKDVCLRIAEKMRAFDGAIKKTRKKINIGTNAKEAKRGNRDKHTSSTNNGKIESLFKATKKKTPKKTNNVTGHGSIHHRVALCGQRDATRCDLRLNEWKIIDARRYYIACVLKNRRQCRRI
jgi:hypothetical protein